ncbi:MAG: type I-E CRISPR-associated protein Cse1/CasA [Fimbriimonadaceae bacterium]|nr:type I-E CRISPR-associated protein Cse1/CasA [Fimbriimonadaceae bacterium]
MSDAAAAWDLLQDPLLTIAGPDGRVVVCLPELLRRLLQGPEVTGFPELAPEQRGYWWRFLVRCATKALLELDCGPDEATTDDLRGVLRDLVPDGGWCLYQPDPARPGFLQVPTPNLTGYVRRPISMLTGAIGSKNHERKADAIRSLTAEQAVYALVEFQTAAIYAANRGYESQLTGSRDCKGSGTPFMGARIRHSDVLTFRHDVAAMAGAYETMAEHLRGTVWAIWCLPWDGQTPLPAVQLDPAFICLARMLRLASPEGGLFAAIHYRPTHSTAKGASGGAPRVQDPFARPAKGKHPPPSGVFGDAFTPVIATEDGPKVRGTLEHGYSYTEVVMLLFGGTKDARRSPSVEALVKAADLDRDDLAVTFEGVAYDQGKTLGFHRREVLLPAIGGDWLSDPTPIRTAHAHLLSVVDDAKSALRGAARIVLSGAPRPRSGDKKKADRPAAVLEQRVDACYLDFLFGAAATIQEQGAAVRFDLPFLEWLQEAAEAALATALPELPVSTNQRFERELRAEAFLKARLRKLRGEEPSKEGTDGTT